MNSKHIGNKVLYDTNVSVKARLLMLFLLEASNEEGEDYLDISISFLCKALGYSNKTIIKAMNELEENGYIEKTRRGLGKNNLYKIIRG